MSAYRRHQDTEADDDFRNTGYYKVGFSRKELEQMVRVARAVAEVQAYQLETTSRIGGHHEKRPKTPEGLLHDWYPIPDLDPVEVRVGDLPPFFLLHPDVRAAEAQHRRILIAGINEALVRGWFQRNGYGNKGAA